MIKSIMQSLRLQPDFSSSLTFVLKLNCFETPSFHVWNAGERLVPSVTLEAPLAQTAVREYITG